jgi:hypothetical protein
MEVANRDCNPAVELMKLSRFALRKSYEVFVAKVGHVCLLLIVIHYHNKWDAGH